MIRAVRKQIRFSQSVVIEAYLVPPDEFRVGITSASTSLGYAENWLYRLLTGKKDKSLKALLGLGFGNLPTVDLMPDGEFRAGLEGSNLLIGYAANWLSRVTTNRPKTASSLMGMGLVGLPLDACTSIFYLN